MQFQRIDEAVVDSPLESTARRMTRELDDPPGGVLFWLVVAVEPFAFAMVFAVVANLRSTDPAAFRERQLVLSSAVPAGWWRPRPRHP